LDDRGTAIIGQIAADEIVRFRYAVAEIGQHPPRIELVALDLDLHAPVVAMQVAAMNPKDLETLLKQDYIRDSSQTIEQLVKGVIGKLGENIVVRKIIRFEI